MTQEFDHIILPGWEVIRKLGEGSFGGVYEIQRTLSDGTIERAALKKLTVPKEQTEITELYAQSYDSESITAHFKEQMQDLVREYSFMQKLGENPNVVHCQDLRTVQHDDGIGWDIYIRMELLTPLKLWLTDRYDERQVIRLGLNMCGALHGCHQRNIIHRDIKPENILVNEEGKFKLGDFGIAKVSEKTATGTLTGTYSYMAPEIANRQHYGASADIYSLGLVMYWMMNERTLPFLPLGKKIPSGVQRQEAQDRRFSGEAIPAPINGSLGLTRIVLKACAFDPKERYHTVQELAEELRNYYFEITGEWITLTEVPQYESVLKERLEEVKTETAQPSGNRKRTKKYNPIFAIVFVGICFVVTALIINIFIARSSISPFLYSYEANDSGITITGYKKELPTVVNLPEKIGGKPVIRIGDEAFKECTTICDITIPESVISIGCYAFSGCTKLSSITIPNSVSSVGSWAFENNSSLGSVSLSCNISHIGEGAFFGCTSLDSITIPDCVTSIGGWTFADCTRLSNISLPEGITEIGELAFGNCSSLSNIVIPDSVASIGCVAFSGCTSLANVIIPDRVTSISDSAFEGCISLNSIIIPDGVARIGESAFAGCISLRDVTINQNCTIGEDAFPATCNVQISYNYIYEKNSNGITITGYEGTLPTKVIIPSEIDGLPVIGIGDSAFAGYLNLNSITIPESVTDIGAFAFMNCSRLDSVVISDGVASIGECAFRECSSLSSITIPDSVTYIGDGAFFKCEKIQSVTLPDHVTTIGECAFGFCVNLDCITIPGSVDEISQTMFSGCTKLSSVTIQEGTTSISYYAFFNCTNLSSIIIPRSVSKIGSMAFSNCTSLMSVTISAMCNTGYDIFPSSCRVLYY